MADTSLPHVTRAKFFRNGDANFKGKVMVVNPRYYRNFESFLDTVTWSTQSTNAVTRICTPHGRHYIHSVDSFQNGGNYVAVGRERFKPLKYGEEKAKNATVHLPPIWRSQRASSGRYRKVYEGEKQALKRIHVYKNGDNRTPARMILLKKRMLMNMELVFATLQESGINFDFPITKLFTLDGKQVYSCDEIEHDGRYVALQRGSRFKPVNYDGSSNFSPRNATTNFTRLPPIANRVNPTKISYSPRKNPEPPSQAKLGPPRQTKPKRIDKKREEKRTKESLLPQDSIVSPFEDQNLQRESFSHVSLSVTPPPLDESPDFTMSDKKAKEHEDSANSPEQSKSPEIAIPTDLEELPQKEQENVGLQLYNASGMQREWGEMIVDNKNTVTDKLIDDIPAQEVIEEEIPGEPEDIPATKKKHPNPPHPPTQGKPYPPTQGKKAAPTKKRIVRGVEQKREPERKDVKQKKPNKADRQPERKKTKQEKPDKIEKQPDQKESKQEKPDKTEKQPEQIEAEPEKAQREKSKDDEIAATATMLVERILQEEENEQEDHEASSISHDTSVDNKRAKSQSPEEEPPEEMLDEEVPEDKVPKEDDATKRSSTPKQEDQPQQSPQPSVVSSQEDINSEDEIQSTDGDDDDDDDEKDDNVEDKDDDDDDDSDSERSDENESEEEKDDTDPQSDNSEPEEPASKENKTNKKVEEQRADPIAAKKKEVKPNHDKGVRKGKRIDNKA